MNSSTNSSRCGVESASSRARAPAATSCGSRSARGRSSRARGAAARRVRESSLEHREHLRRSSAGSALARGPAPRRRGAAPRAAAAAERRRDQRRELTLPRPRACRESSSAPVLRLFGAVANLVLAVLHVGVAHGGVEVEGRLALLAIVSSASERPFTMPTPRRGIAHVEGNEVVLGSADERIDGEARGVARVRRPEERQHQIGPGGTPQTPSVWPKSSSLGAARRRSAGSKRPRDARTWC